MKGFGKFEVIKSLNRFKQKKYLSLIELLMKK